MLGEAADIGDDHPGGQGGTRGIVVAGTDRGQMQPGNAIQQVRGNGLADSAEPGDRDAEWDDVAFMAGVYGRLRVPSMHARAAVLLGRRR